MLLASPPSTSGAIAVIGLFMYALSSIGVLASLPVAAGLFADSELIAPIIPK
jgi:hypothetical protein